MFENKISEIKEKKGQVIRSQRYEEAAKLRDVEKQLNESLEYERNKWEEDSLNNKQTVTEENVAEVVSMISGIPLQRVSESETSKLAKMQESITGKIVGQDEAVKSIVKAIEYLKDSGLKVISAAERSGVVLTEAKFSGPTVLILGSEEKGISRELISLSDFQVKIPMTGTIESLNVSVAAGIFLYEIIRQRSA